MARRLCIQCGKSLSTSAAPQAKRHKECQRAAYLQYMREYNRKLKLEGRRPTVKRPPDTRPFVSGDLTSAEIEAAMAAHLATLRHARRLADEDAWSQRQIGINPFVPEGA